jgi:hypothetical protein
LLIHRRPSHDGMIAHLPTEENLQDGNKKDQAAPVVAEDGPGVPYLPIK